MSTNHLSDGDGLPTISAEDILESLVSFGVITTDLNGLITRWNEGARNIFGWTAEEMLGEPVSRLISSGSGESLRPSTEMEQALLFGHTVEEGWHIRKNDERFWAYSELMALKSRSGSYWDM